MRARTVLSFVVVLISLTLAGCRARVPDEAWARRVFGANHSALDALAARLEAAVGELPPIKPSEGDDYKTKMKHYDDLKARCETLKTKVVAEIKKTGNIVEWQTPLKITGAPPTEAVPCLLNYSYSPREERFGDVAPEAGFTVERWQVGRRLVEIQGKKQPGLEVLTSAIVGGLTFEMRLLVMDKP